MKKKIKEVKEIKEEPEKTYLISKAENYKGHTIVFGVNTIDKDRAEKFNEGEQIEVTQQELNEIGYHRWLISEVK